MWPWKSHQSNDLTSDTAASKPDLLAISADASDREMLVAFAGSDGWNLKTVSTVEEGLMWAANVTVQVILLDRDLTGNWRSAVQSLAAKRPTPSVVLASAVTDHYLFEEIVKHGGFDVIAKPLHSDELRRIGRLAFIFWKNRWAPRPSV